MYLPVVVVSSVLCLHAFMFSRYLIIVKADTWTHIPSTRIKLRNKINNGSRSFLEDNNGAARPGNPIKNKMQYIPWTICIDNRGRSWIKVGVTWIRFCCGSQNIEVLGQNILEQRNFVGDARSPSISNSWNFSCVYESMEVDKILTWFEDCSGINYLYRFISLKYIMIKENLQKLLLVSLRLRLDNYNVKP